MDMRNPIQNVLLDTLENQTAAVGLIGLGMRDYPHLQGHKGVQAEAVQANDYDAILISTDHDAVDYTALMALDIPMVDTRNAIAARDLPMGKVTKA